MAAFNTGHGRGCGTVHANSAADVPARLAALAAVAVLALAVGAVVSVGAQLRCVDAARAAARVAARGDSDTAASQAGQQVAPPGARVRVVHRGDQVEVQVAAEVRLFRLPSVRVHARAVAEAEGR